MIPSVVSARMAGVAPSVIKSSATDDAVRMASVIMALVYVILDGMENIVPLVRKRQMDG